MKIGNIVRDKYTKELGIIVGRYDGDLDFDFEVITFKQLFRGGHFRDGHIWRDCVEEDRLELYDWKEYPKMVFERLKHLLRMK